jgi:uncharacterized membrane protein (Fun14 family)
MIEFNLESITADCESGFIVFQNRGWAGNKSGRVVFKKRGARHISSAWSFSGQDFC